VSLVIRPMAVRDVEAVGEVDRRCFRTPWSDRAFLTELGNRAALYFVAERNGRVIGFAGSWLVMDELHVTTVGVDPEERGRGVGDRLVGALLAEAVRRGARRSSLEVRRSGVAAQNLYAKWGFAPVWTRKNYYTEEHEDAIVMWIEDMTAPAFRERLRANLEEVRGWRSEVRREAAETDRPPRSVQV
jgi:[ribosomal protein S18]-alanine N-acetyltransferase